MEQVGGGISLLLLLLAGGAALLSNGGMLPLVLVFVGAFVLFGFRASAAP